MDKYIGYLVPLSEASRTWNKEWYKADDVADLARRVLPWIESGVGYEDADGNKEGVQKGMGLIAELEQIAGK